MNHSRKTLSYARLALGQIEALNLPADPPNYELWYIYATQHNPALNAEINRLLSEKGSLSDDDLHALHARHLVSHHVSTILQETANTLSGEIGDISSIIENALASSAELDRSLGHGISKLGSGTSRADMIDVVRGLINATKEAQERTRVLETRLAASKERAAALELNVEKIRLETATDALTRVGNRRFFDESLSRLVKEARATARSLALLLVDIDHFKNVNDKHGHQTGDHVLRLVAMAIKSCLRAEDILARYGGEEFAIILPDADVESGKAVAERVRCTVKGKEVVKRSTREKIGFITVSIGIAWLGGEEPIESLIERADQHLYAAKRNGRDQVMTEHGHVMKSSGAVRLN